jgi:maltooligosyltrehalose trehalohydrolase
VVVRLGAQYCGPIPEDKLPVGAFRLADGRFAFRVWCPQTRHLELLIQQEGRWRSFPGEPGPGGLFEWVFEDPFPEGTRYSYRLNAGPSRPDPASRWQPEGVFGPSAVLRTDQFEWTDQGWAGLPWDEVVFYELHVGTFSPAGTFDAVQERLSELRDLGVTAVELMPVAQFSGTRNWGYDGVFPYAVQNSYGGPQGLQRLVDACHREGLAVFLDVVYNHFGPEGCVLQEYGPYTSHRYRTPWGDALNFDQAYCDAVRCFVIENALYWLREFHLDGLRLDAIHAIYDSSPRHILSELSQRVAILSRSLERPLYLVAESNLNDVRVLDSPDRRGYGLHAQWCDDFHHAVHALLTGERDGYYVDFGRPEQLCKAINEVFVYDGQYSAFRKRRYGAPATGYPKHRFVVAIQTHDQVGNRALGDRLAGLLPPAACRLAASLLLLSPFTPLLFMGEEYGETHPFPFFCSFSDPQLAEAVRQGRRQEFRDFAWPERLPDPQAEETFRSAVLSWCWEAEPFRAGLRRLYQALLRARQRWPPLRRPGIAQASLHRTAGTRGILILFRQSDSDPPARLWAFFNLDGMTQPLPQTALRPASRVLFCSELQVYGGATSSVQPLDPLAPYECRVLAEELWEP